MSDSDEIYESLAGIAGALANPRRLRALNLLFQGPKAIETLAGLLGESEANTAAHMKVLRAAGLVTAKRDGKYLLQEPVLPAALQLFLALRASGEALSPAVRVLNAAEDPSVSPVAPKELGELTESGRVLLLDLRPNEEFCHGHLPGAHSLPFARLTERSGHLPKRRRILVYCRGKYCPNARKGTLLLREAGLRAERLRFGVPEWRAEGRKVERGEV